MSLVTLLIKVSFEGSHIVCDRYSMELQQLKLLAVIFYVCSAHNLI